MDETLNRHLKEIKETANTYVQKELVRLDKNFMDYLYNWNEKYYRDGLADAVELINNIIRIKTVERK